MTRLCPGDKVRRTEASDERGQFAFAYIDSVIPSNSILVEFSKPGYRTVTIDMRRPPAEPDASVRRCEDEDVPLLPGDPGQPVGSAR